ncbi:MAG: Ig-like domain-containing protein, partial [Actinomycetia bacterium]|nr:Ig-like domain-containing protein [Actinomycetes bacterium]
MGLKRGMATKRLAARGSVAGALWLLLTFAALADLGQLSAAPVVSGLSAGVTGTVVNVGSKVLNVRNGPSMSSAISSSLSAGTAVTVTGYTSDGWLRISYAGGKTGYVSSSYVNVPVTSVWISSTSASLAIGATTQLSAGVSPACASQRGISWTSSNTAVATVSTTGKVTAKKTGNARITASSGGRSASCNVSVGAASNIGVSGATAVPTTMKKGTVVVVVGTVSSNY